MCTENLLFGSSARALPVVNFCWQQFRHKLVDSSPRVGGNFARTTEIETVLDDKLTLLEFLGHHTAVTAGVTTR